MKRYAYVIGLLFFAHSVFAENTQTPTQPLGRGINVFNDKVFEDAPPPPPAPAAADGTRRPRADAANYNKQQGDQWTAACSKEREKSSAEFKKCFEANRSKALGENERRQTEIEMRQSAPARNSVPSIEMDKELREPAFKGVTIEKEDE